MRSLQPIPLEHGGQTMVAMRDPAGLCNSMLLLTPAAYHLTRLMNGRRTPEEICRAFGELSGVEIAIDHVAQLISQLDEVLALDNQRSRGFVDNLKVRPMAHAGGAYPEEPEQLKIFLDELIESESSFVPPERSLSGLMIPHIDLSRGAASYSRAYRELKAHLDKFDTYVVLGISHAGCEAPFILTRKSFETPLGIVETDVEFVDELAAAVDFASFQDEFNHFGEHSVEFQAVFLKHLAPHARIVPVLCGSFHECLEGDAPMSPRKLPGVESFLNALGDALGSRRRVCVLASVDLAHVGERFGGTALTGADLERLRKRDAQTLEHAVDGQSEAFIASLQSDRGTRNYCGTSAIYTMLECLGRPRGELHLYQQCTEPGNTSTVTVAAAGYYC